MIEATRIPNHDALALKRLLEEFKKSTLFKGYMAALSAQVQDLEDAMFASIAARSIDGATGDTLDRIGDIVGVQRASGFNDDQYRVFIYAKIGANISQGETERVIAVYKLLTGGTYVELREYFPASITLFSDGVIDEATAYIIGLLIGDVMAAGVSIDFYGVFGSEDFTLGDYYAATSDSTGFGDYYDLTAGGKWADANAQGGPAPSLEPRMLQQTSDLVLQENNGRVLI